MTLRPKRRWSRPIAFLLLIPLLVGCGGLIPAAPERQLYQLAPVFAFAAPLPHTGAQLAIGTPTAPAALATDRIAVSRSPVTLDYFADAQWSDKVTYLVQTALVDGFGKSGAMLAVGRDSLGFAADFGLDTAIDDFAAVQDSPGEAPHVVVKLHVTLVGVRDRKILAQTTVSREATATANSLPAVVAAFDQALGGAISEVVSWTAGNPLLSERRVSGILRTRFVHAGGGGKS